MAGQLPFEGPSREDLLNLYGGQYSSGYQGLMQERVGQQQGLADLFIKSSAEGLRHDKTVNPLKETQVSLENDALTENIRGTKAKNDFTEKTKQSVFDEFVAKNRGSIQREHLEEMTRLGQMMMQAGAQVGGITDPVLRNLKAKQIFEQNGFGDSFDDTIDASKFSDIGKAMLLANAKAQQAFQLQDDKDTAAGERAAAALKSKERIAALQAQVRRQVASVQKQPAAKRAGSYQALSAQLMDRAIEAQMSDDNETAQYLQGLAQQLAITAQNYAVAGAQARQAGQPDVGAITDLPTLPGPAPIQVPTLPQTAPVRSQTAPPPARRSPPLQPNPAGTPVTPAPRTGQKVRVKGPDGQTGMIPFERLEAYLANGYKEVR